MSEEKDIKLLYYKWGIVLQENIKKETDKLIAEFLAKLYDARGKVIDLNLERNMKAEDHIKYNDVFNVIIDELEERVRDATRKREGRQK